MICSCSLCTAHVAAEQKRISDRQAYERSIDEQYASVCAGRKARGEPPLSKAMWMAGFDGDEETDDAQQSSGDWTVFVIFALIGVFLLVGWLMS